MAVDPLSPHLSFYPDYDPKARGVCFIEHLDACVQVGECFVVKHYVTLENTLTSRICRIVAGPRNFSPEASSGMPKGRYVEVSYYVSAKSLIQSEQFPSLPTAIPLSPPPDRTYIQYAQEVILTPYRKWIPTSELQAAAFLFHSTDCEEKEEVSYALGMENSFTVVGRWDSRVNRILPNDYETSPFYTVRQDSYTRRKFFFYKTVATLIWKDLCKSGIQQRLSSTNRLNVSTSDWRTLERRLVGRVPMIQRTKSCCTRILPRRSGIREAIKSRYTMEVFRASTVSHIDTFVAVFGRSIRAGACIKPVVASGSLRKQDGYRKNAVSIPRNGDESHGFFKMPRSCNEAFKIRSRLPRIDLIFNPLTEELTIRLQYRMGSLKEVAVKNALHRRCDSKLLDQPVGVPIPQALNFSDSDDSSQEDNNSDDDDCTTSCQQDLFPGSYLVAHETEFEASGILFLFVFLRRQRITDKEYAETVVTESTGVVGRARPTQRYWFGRQVERGSATFTAIAQEPTANCEFVPLPERSVGSTYEDNVPCRDDCVFWKVSDAIKLVKSYNGIA